MSNILIGHNAYYRDIPRYNPWINLDLDARFHNMIYSVKMAERIRSIQAENFPYLFRQYAMSDSTMTTLTSEVRSRITTDTAASLERIDQATQSCVNKLLADDIRFAEIRQAIQTATENRVERGENQRNETLNAIESRVAKLQSRQYLTFIGGLAVGIGCAVFNAVR